MSGILASITGALSRLFENLLPSWGEPSPVLPELPEPPEPEEGSEEEESDYETALTYQNTETRWFSAIRRFLFWKKQAFHIEFYDGSTQWIGSENDFRNLSRDWFLIKANSNETLQEVHKRYNEEADAILWRSDEQIDLRKTGTYAMASLRFFQDVTRGPIRAEDLSEEEDYWIRSAYMGGIVWAEPYEGIATELDFNEFYPNILASGVLWPIGPGEFKTISHITIDPNSYDLKYGIYRANIEGQPVGHKCTSTFRFNPAGFYTHYDLQLAKSLGLRIELSSESPNALIFGGYQLMNGLYIFYQWASRLRAIKNKGGLAGKVAKQMLVSLWGRLYTDGRRPGPHRRMAPFISARGRQFISEKIKPLEERVKRIHTDGFIISGENTDQQRELIERYVGEGRDFKIAKTGIVTIKNVMNLKWADFEEIIPSSTVKSEKSPIRYTSLPNEILDRIFHYHRKNEGEKLHPLLLVNKQWHYVARRLIWQKIVLTDISGVKFTKALSKDTKPDACAQVLDLKFIGKINIRPDVYISEVCKVCPNLQQLSFEDCGSRILNDKNLEELLAECPNLKSLTIRDSNRISPKTFLKIPKLAPGLKMVEIEDCPRIEMEKIADFQNLYPQIKLLYI